MPGHLDSTHDGIPYGLLTSDINRKVEFLHIEMAPGVRTPAHGVSQHNGEENQYCLEGQYVLDLNGQGVRISCWGLSIVRRFAPHVAYNRSKKRAVIIVAITLPNL